VNDLCNLYCLWVVRLLISMDSCVWSGVVVHTIVYFSIMFWYRGSVRVLIMTCLVPLSPFRYLVYFCITFVIFVYDFRISSDFVPSHRMTDHDRPNYSVLFIVLTAVNKFAIYKDVWWQKNFYSTWQWWFMFISDCRPAPKTREIIVINSNLSVQHLHLTGPDSWHSPIAKWWIFLLLLLEV